MINMKVRDLQDEILVRIPIRVPRDPFKGTKVTVDSRVIVRTWIKEK